MGTKTGVSSNDGVVSGLGIIAGLESLRHQEQTRLSRVLHDDIGPSLCSAGLMIGLLRSSWTELNQEARELLDSIQDALETSIDSIRLLSYQSDPTLAGRCGFRSALDHLTRGRPVEVIYAALSPEFAPAEAEFLCRLVRTSLDRTLSSCRIHVGAHDLSVHGSIAFEPNEIAALTALGETFGVVVSYQGPPAECCLSAAVRGGEAQPT